MSEVTSVQAARSTGVSDEEGARRITLIWMVTGAVLLPVLALAGLMMRLTQSLTGLIPPRAFYALLTFHGIGMVGVVLMIITALFWYVMSKGLPLSVWMMKLVYIVTMVGVVGIVISCLAGFGTGWTFLYPLPSTPGPTPGWPTWAGYFFLVGLALVVIAYSLFCLDFLRAGIVRLGGLGRMLGYDIIMGKAKPGPDTTDPSIVAGTVVALGGLSAALPGALVVILEIVHIADPSIKISALLAKNLIFFAGHMLVNVQIYTGAAIIYAALPRYINRPWKANRILCGAWSFALIAVMLAYFHHLYQDFAQANGLQIAGEIISFGVAFPPIVVTIFSGLVLTYRSGIKWTTAPILLYAALAGWAIGGWGAETGDASPIANQYFHNTVWVPAHFHTYMALGVLFFMVGTLYHVMPQLTGRSLSEPIGRTAAALMIVGGYGLVAMWYLGGALGQPRRYPISIPSALSVSRVGATFGAVVFIGVLLILFDLVRTLLPEPAKWWASRPLQTIPQAGAGS